MFRIRVSRSKLEDNLLILLLLFAPLALASVNIWAYCTIAIISLTIFNLHFLNDIDALKRVIYLPVSIGMLLLILIAIFYVVPLPEKVIKILNPAAFDLRKEYMLQQVSRQTLSIYPRATLGFLIKIVSYMMIFLFIVSKIIRRSPALPLEKVPSGESAPREAEKLKVDVSNYFSLSFLRVRTKFSRIAGRISGALSVARKVKAESQKPVQFRLPQSMFHTFILLGALSGILSILFHSVCDFNLRIPANALYFTVILAIVTGLSLNREKYSFNYNFVRKLITSIVIIGFVIAVFGIAQKFTWNGKIYWLIEKPGSHFGPYLNCDHYAGYMEMCVFLAMACFAGNMASSSFFRLKKIKEKILWFSSPEANKTVMYIFSCVVMASALFLTASRGGIISFSLAMLVFFYLIIINIKKGRRSRFFFSLVLTVLLITVMVLWFGSETILLRFKMLNEITRYVIYESPILIELRPFIWKDTVNLIKDFPVSGVGLGAYSYVFPQYRTFSADWGLLRYAHSDYLQFLAEAGLAAHIFLIGFFVWFFKKFGICSRRFKEL